MISADSLALLALLLFLGIRVNRPRFRADWGTDMRLESLIKALVLITDNTRLGMYEV